MIRNAVMSLERWAFDDESVLLGTSKAILIICSALAIVFAPILYCSSRQETTAENQCLRRGGGWAITGSHQQTTMMMVGKVFVPQTHTVTEYGCVQVNR